MAKIKDYFVPFVLLLILNLRYYPGNLELTLKQNFRFLLASFIYGLAFAFIFKWFLRQFLRRELSRENFVKIALWAAVIMAFGEFLRVYFAPY